jgi:small-conductance mechanosensitive channel/predicted  nucleic acid-binding Zn-ribbon protein
MQNKSTRVLGSKRVNIFRKGLSASLLLVLLLPLVCFSAQDTSNQQSNVPSPQDVLSFINQSIGWYRQLSTEQQIANEPEDIIFVSDDRQLATQILRLSFDFGLAYASSPNLAPSTQQAGSPTQDRYQQLLQLANTADQQVKDTQVEIENARRKLETAPLRKRKEIESQISELQAELELAQTRRETLRNMLQFVTGANGNGGTLRAQLEELQRVIPTNEQTSNQGQSSAQDASNVSARKAESTGILGLVTDLISLSKKVHTIDDRIQQTNNLQQAAKQIRTPFSNKLRELVKGGNDIVAQPDATDPAVLAQQKQQLETMTAQFKQAAALVMPLSKQSILFDLYKRSLSNWHDAVKSEYSTALRNLLIHLGVLAFMVALIVGMAEVWRRAIFRYVHDFRRRYQFMLLRRLVMWFLIAIVVAFAFASELGSLATFAGLMTAGIAVALQNVILSVAGYFYLIGKYGIRVGDRVQISGVTGEVVDIGLVRLHLMELATTGTDAQPTGRVVVFSNSVVFQPSSGLYKQIPGTNFVWHQISLTLAPEGNYREVESRLLNAVESVFKEYKDALEQQRLRMQHSLSVVSDISLHPQSHFHLTQAGLEVVIRYPLVLDKAAEVDDKITRALLEAIERSPKLRLVGTGTPNIQAVSEPAEPVAKA